jgi:hypothetical protein
MNITTQVLQCNTLTTNEHAPVTSFDHLDDDDDNTHRPVQRLRRRQSLWKGGQLSGDHVQCEQQVLGLSSQPVTAALAHITTRPIVPHRIILPRKRLQALHD